MAGTADDVRPARVRRKASWLLTQAAARAHRSVSAALTDSGSHQHQYLLLSALEEFGPSSQAGLGRRTGLDRSDIVNALAEQELVARAVDPTNRRRNVVTVSRAGSSRLRELDRVLDGVQDELLAPLTPADRAGLMNLLTRLVDHHAER